MRVTMILLAVVLTITGCSSTPAPAPQPEPGLLTVGIGQPANGPAADRMISNALYTPLVDYDPATGKVTLRAAESVSSSPTRSPGPSSCGPASTTMAPR